MSHDREQRDEKITGWGWLAILIAAGIVILLFYRFTS
jgi:hypothetical protein